MLVLNQSRPPPDSSNPLSLHLLICSCKIADFPWWYARSRRDEVECWPELEYSPLNLCLSPIGAGVSKAMQPSPLKSSLHDIQINIVVNLGLSILEREARNGTSSYWRLIMGSSVVYRQSLLELIGWWYEPRVCTSCTKKSHDLVSRTTMRAQVNTWQRF